MSEANPPDLGSAHPILAERRAKLQRLRQLGPAYPNDFVRAHTAAELHARYGDASRDELAQNPVAVAVAGRMMLRRLQGKVSFATLQDGSGRIQLFVSDDDAGAQLHQEFRHWDIGDIVGARGELFRTHRGELSVRCRELRLLAKALRPLPDKFHGLADHETRYRQRYVDLIVNESTRRVFQIRSSAMAEMRRFMTEQGFLEVETPMLQPIPGGAAARPFVTHHHALDVDMYLRIAPELYLKRLVVGGFERVFEIGRLFRNEGISPRHNPEFTTIELYEAYADYRDLMVLVEELVAGLARDLLGTTELIYQGRPLDLSPPWRRATMAELVSEAVGRPVDVHTGPDELRRLLASAGVDPDPRWGPGKLFLELYEKTTESTLWGPIYVCDYPAEVSPLARRHRDDPDLVERFEAIVAGRELLNAFTELVDPDEQRARFDEQAALRSG